MTKAEADIEAKKIFDESIEEAEKITQKAKENGTWQRGLDGNKELFEELHKKTKEKLKELTSKIDKE